MSKALTTWLFLVSFTTPLAAEIVWHFPTPVSANAFVTKHHIKFADKVYQESEGSIKIIAHPAGSLFKLNDILRTVRTRQVAMGATGLGLHAIEEPIFGLMFLPFLTRNVEEARRLDRISRPALEAALEKMNLKLLYTGVWTPQGLFSVKPLLEPEDMAGMKIRTYDSATTRIAQLVDAIPTKTDASEVAMAFSTGVVEGSFTSGATGVSQKLWDYIDYYYTINATFATSTVIVNLDEWRELETDLQSMIMRIAIETEQNIWNEMMKKEESYNSKMRQAGMQVLRPSNEISSYLTGIGKQIADEWILRAGEEGKSILRKFHADD